MNFTAKDLVAIIKSIQGTGIRRLEFNGLIIQCDDSEKVRTIGAATPLFPQEDLYHPVENHRNPDDIEQTIQAEIDNDPMLQEIERQNLMIQDPAAFELMMDREDQNDAENDQRIKQSVSKVRHSADDSSSRAKNERLA